MTIRRGTAAEMISLWVKENTTRFFREALESGRAEFWTAEDHGRLVGELYAFLTLDDARFADGASTAYLCAFRVAEDMRGRGIGTMLVSRVMERLRDLGFSFVTIGVEPAESGNLRLYRNLGFFQTAGSFTADPCDIGPDGKPAACRSFLLLRRYLRFTGAATAPEPSPLTLAVPSPEFKEDAMLYRGECLAADGNVGGSGGLHNFSDYGLWLARLARMGSEETVPEGLVPSSTFFAVLPDRRIAGMIDIRHRLNGRLTERGGHIGYSIRPSMRGRGFAAAMLGLGLCECAALGLARVLITCDRGNLPSARTAQHWGGIEEFTDCSVREGFRRFWIALG